LIKIGVRQRGITLKDGITVCAAIAVIINTTIGVAGLLKQNLMIFVVIASLVIISAVAVQKLIKSKSLKPISIIMISIVFLMLVALAVVAWSRLADSNIEPIKIIITNPSDGDNVTMRHIIKGTVSDPAAQVYVIVHPLSIPEMWVSYPSMVSPDGKWQDEVYFGTETLGIGEQYELTATATNENFFVTLATGNFFREGQTMSSIPRNTNKANVITVFRPK
jgi:hypothetical protein